MSQNKLEHIEKLMVINSHRSQLSFFSNTILDEIRKRVESNLYLRDADKDWIDDIMDIVDSSGLSEEIDKLLED